jgi:glutamine amidotransferase
MLAIVDYGVGNLRSVENMARKAGAQATMATTPEAIKAADRVILPGVGHFGYVMKALTASVLLQAVTEHALERKRPLLGICVGAQVLGTGSEEAPAVAGLGWLPMSCRRFPNSPGLRVPHMSWNTLRLKRPTPLFPNLDPDARFYFVHSYYMAAETPEVVVAETEYGLTFASVVGRGNIFGTQFHLEKSHRFGIALMQAFAAIPLDIATRAAAHSPA